MAVAALALLAVVALYAFNVRPALANLALSRSITLTRLDDLPAALVAMDESLALGTSMRFEARQKFNNLTLKALRSSAFTPEAKRVLFEKTERELLANIREEPEDAFHLVYLLTLYNGSEHVDPSVLDRIPAVFEQANRLSPGRAPLYYELGQAKMSQGKFDEGISAFREAVTIAPNVMEAHWNLGAALVVGGYEAEGEAEFQRAAELGLNLKSLRHLTRVLRVYNAKRDFRKLAETYEAIAAIEPSAPVYASLAAAYKELGEIEKAKIAVEQAVALDGSYAPEAEEFLRSLRGVKGARGSQQGLR